MSQSISNDVLDVLRSAEIDGNLVRLPGQLDRALYQKVNECLERLGGKWKSGRTKAHVFPEHKNPKLLIDDVLQTGLMPDKNPLAFFPTPKPIVQMMLNRAAERNGDFPYCRILEPSAGDGAIADELMQLVKDLDVPGEICDLELIELDKERCESLERKGYAVRQADFTSRVYGSENNFHCVLMNPPFAIEGDQKAYITHIQHAWKQLKNGGVLVAVAPPGFTFATDAKSKNFKRFVEQNGKYEDLPEAAFKESGTGIRTVLITLVKAA